MISNEQAKLETQLGYAWKSLWRAQQCAESLGWDGLYDDLGMHLSALVALQEELLKKPVGRRLRRPSAAGAETPASGIARSRSRE
jgi:hypothetical protein